MSNLIEKRKIVGFFELSDDWQKEALRNLDDLAITEIYLEPLPETTPEKHILWDLSEAMKQTGNHFGFDYNAVITISNNSAMLLNIDEGFEMAEIKYV
jgi:hypothetical protein